MHLPDFLSIYLFFGRAEVQRSRSCHIGANGGSSFDVNTEILFQENCPFRLSCGLAWFAWCCEVVNRVEEARHQQLLTSVAGCLNLVPCNFEIEFESYSHCQEMFSSRNFLFDSWFDCWVGQRFSKQLRPTASKCEYVCKIMQASRTRWALRNTIKALLLQSA